MPDKEIIHEEEYKHTVESNRDKAGMPKLLNKTFNKIQPFDYDFGKDQSNLDEEQEQEEVINSMPYRNSNAQKNNFVNKYINE